MKMKRTKFAFSDLSILTGLAAAGIVLTVFAVYGAGRTSSNKPQRQQLPSGPAPKGSVTEAWVRRINGPDSVRDHRHDVATDATGHVYVTGCIETTARN